MKLLDSSSMAGVVLACIFLHVAATTATAMSEIEFLVYGYGDEINPLKSHGPAADSPSHRRSVGLPEGLPGRPSVLKFGVAPEAVIQALAYDPFVPLIVGACLFGLVVLSCWVAYFWRYPMTLGEKLDPATSTWWQRNKILVVTIAHARNFIVSGVIYGYPALELVLRSMGVYGENCIPGSQCPEQIEGFAAISLAGFLLNIAGRPIWGFGLDFLGPRNTSTLGMSTCAVGIVPLIFAGPDKPYLFAIGWGLLGFGGASIHLANFHIQNLFPKNKKPVSASFTITFAASAIVFTVVAALYDVGFAWGALMVGYFVITVAITVISWFLQPAATIGRDGRTIDDAAAPVKMSASVTTSPKLAEQPIKDDTETTIKAKPAMTAVASTASINSDDGDWNDLSRTALTSTGYWLETLWFGFGVLQYQWYIATLAAQLLNFPLPGATPTEAARVAAVYLQNGNVYNSFSGLSWPISAWLLAAFDSITPSVVVQLVTQIVYTVTLTIPSFAFQPLTFAIQGLSRFILFSAHHSYLSTEFSMKIFGVLNAATYVTSALFTVFVFPLQLIAAYTLGGNYVVINWMFTFANACILLAMGFSKISSAVKRFFKVDEKDELTSPSAAKADLRTPA